jgi:hypothetical protein
MSYEKNSALNASRTERDFAQSPQAKRGSAQDLTIRRSRGAHDCARAREDGDVPDFSNQNEPQADGGGVYGRPRRPPKYGSSCRRERQRSER